MEPVGELEQNHANVGRHRDDHLAVILSLRLVARLERERVKLGDAINQRSNLGAEDLLDLVNRNGSVLNRVMEQRRHERFGIEPEPGADRSDANRVADELFA